MHDTSYQRSDGTDRVNGWVDDWGAIDPRVGGNNCDAISWPNANFHQRISKVLYTLCPVLNEK